MANIIPDGTDLNTLITPGNYKVLAAANAATMINGPTTAVAYRLIILQINNTNRYMQIAFANSGGTPKILFRNYAGTAWNKWRYVATDDNTIYLSNKILTSNNYLSYFQNAKLSDALPNTIWGIYDTSLFSDAPDGDNWIGTQDRETGEMRGTLITVSQSESHSYVQSGLTQFFIGYRNTSYYPTLSYRIAIASNDEYIWSAWSKFEQNGYLRASNLVVYGGSLDKTFDDMNDMPSNTIVQIDLNVNGSDAEHTLANHPAPGVSCVAMCYAFSYTTQHGKVQTVYTIDGRLYWRYGYFQSTNDYRWTAWRQCISDAGDYIRNKGRLPNGSDFNNIVENGVYMLGAYPASAYINSPLTTGSGFLTSKLTNDVCLQTVEALNGTRYTRYSIDAGDNWSAWK